MSKLAVAGVIALVLGCGGGRQPAAPVANSISPGLPASTALLTIDERTLGPIDAGTPANLTALRALFAKDGYTVEEVDHMGAEYHVSLEGELLFYVIGNDDGSLFNVHVVSPRVAVGQHPEWKIGAPFTGDELLTHCECWGEHPVCFRKGDHVAVAFERACDGLDDARMRRVLAGVTIQRAVWSPQPFGYDHVDDMDPRGGVPGGVFGGDPCGIP